jgi:hypothetical protein
VTIWKIGHFLVSKEAEYFSEARKSLLVAYYYVMFNINKKFRFIKKIVNCWLMSECYCDKPNSLSALKAVARPTSSGFLFMKAAISSTMLGKEHGSFRWNVQYRCKYSKDRSVSPAFTCCGSLEALVLGYMNGESVSTRSLSNGRRPSSNSFRTPVSDLS